MTSGAISAAAIAQARYALFEKSLKVRGDLYQALTVFPADSVNVKFWLSESARVNEALAEFGGPTSQSRRRNAGAILGGATGGRDAIHKI